MKKSYIAVLSFGLGLCTGYLVQKKKYDSVIADWLEWEKEVLAMSEELQKMVDENTHEVGDYNQLYDESPDSDQAKEPKEPIVYNSIKPPLEFPTVSEDDYEESIFDDESEEIVNVFDRSLDEPYLITAQEFEDGENEKLSIMYYEGDDTLVDDLGDPIDNVNACVGDYSLNCFDEDDCEDPNVIYVRNNKLGVDYEVLRVEGGYAEIVLGITSDDSQASRSSMHAGYDR